MRSGNLTRSLGSPLLGVVGAAALTALLRYWRLDGNFVASGVLLLIYVLVAAAGRRAVVAVCAALAAAAGYVYLLWPARAHGAPAISVGGALVWFLVAMFAVAATAEIWRDRERAADGALLALERRYRRLFERNMAAVYTATKDGRLLDCNEMCARMFGFSGRTQMLARPIEQLYLRPEDRQAFLAAVEEHKHLAGREACYRRADGAPLWVLESASWVADRNVIEGTMVDITERRQAEEMLRAREHRFRALIENSTEAIALADPTGTFIFASENTERVLGYKPADLLRRKFQDLLHPEDRAAAGALWAQAAARAGAILEVQFRCQHRDGSWRWLGGSFKNLLEEPAVRAMVINYGDISERKALEDQLRQSQKMEAMGRLAGGIAHDFNNLLTVINGYSDIALLRVGENEPLHKQLAEIKRAGERAAGLTRQLLAFSRQQALAPRVVDLNELVQSMEAMLRPLIGEQIEVVTRLAAQRARVRADPGQIEQIVLNLAVNARDAMPKGGELTLITSLVDVTEAGAGSGPPPGRYVMLCVRDTGMGIKPELISRIFEPFFTTKEKGKGTGLGLAMVYGIVQQSGGHVEVRSEVGRGTSFFVYLPEAAVAGNAGGGRSGKGPETILLAEDEDGVRTLLRDALVAEGYRVLESRDGAEALTVCAEHGASIDLLLTDVVMPNLDGRALAERMRALHPAVKILFMSGYADPGLGEISALGPLLQKPFAAETVGEKVREVLGQR